MQQNKESLKKFDKLYNIIIIMCNAFYSIFYVNMGNTNINVSGSANEDLTKGNVLNSETGDIATNLESNEKYIKLEEFDVEGHKVSFGEHKNARFVYDVYLENFAERRLLVTESVILHYN